MTRAFRGINPSLVRDPKLRAAFTVLEDELVRVAGMIQDVLQTDERSGKTRVVAPVVLRELPADPTLRSTLGHEGELAKLDNVVYMKRHLNGEDKNWVPVGGDAAASGEVGMTFQAVTILPHPVPPGHGLIILKRQPAMGDAVYVKVQLDNGSWDLLLLGKRDVG